MNIITRMCDDMIYTHGTIKRIGLLDKLRSYKKGEQFILTRITH